eukprot:scaffold81407_cov23-Tisochrysis_lutea.AAC.1
MARNGSVHAISRTPPPSEHPLRACASSTAGRTVSTGGSEGGRLGLDGLLAQVGVNEWVNLAVEHVLHL